MTFASLDRATVLAQEYARLTARGETARLAEIESTIFDLVGYSDGNGRMVLPRTVAEHMGRPFLAGSQ